MPIRFLALASVLTCVAAQAQNAGLNDPTRPPAILSAPAAPAPLAPGQYVPSGVPEVQSILVSLRPGGRRVAVIDGKTLQAGDRIGGAVVESIQPTHVVLRKGGQKQILKLFRPAAPVAAV